MQNEVAQVVPKEPKEKAKRNEVAYRYDLLDSDFLHCLAEIAHYGAEKYGEGNWMKSPLTGGKSPANHIYKHLMEYKNGRAYDHPEVGEGKKYHLAAIAFNAMMEFYYATRSDT